MIKITVPATSANLGPGFDVIGIAFKMYNTFYFELNEYMNVDSADEKISNLNNNLVIKSYIKAFEIAKKDVVNINLRIESDVPFARGLGSSATCVVAGVVAANYYMNNFFTKQEIINIITLLEGHPDNVTPAFLGGLVASFVENEVTTSIKYEVSNDLKFHMLIPNYKISTKESRKALPTKLTYPDIIYNLSRVANLPHALNVGDLDLLVMVTADKMHQPYRFGYISEYNKIYKYAKEHNYPLCLSGSGPALLLITKEEVIDKIKKIIDWEVYCLEVDINGTQVEEL